MATYTAPTRASFSSLSSLLIASLAACETPPASPDADATTTDAQVGSEVDTTPSGLSGRLVWTHGIAGGLVVWDLAAASAVLERGATDQPQAPSLSPSGTKLAYIRTNTIVDGRATDVLAWVDLATGAESRLPSADGDALRRAAQPAMAEDGTVAYLDTLITFDGANMTGAETRIALWSGSGDPTVLVAAEVGESPASSGPRFVSGGSGGAAVVFASDADETWVTSPGFYRKAIAGGGDPDLVATYDVASIDAPALAASPCSWAVSADGGRFVFLATPSSAGGTRGAFVVSAGGEPVRIAGADHAGCVTLTADGETALVLDADPALAGETRLLQVDAAAASPAATDYPELSADLGGRRVTAVGVSALGTLVALGTSGASPIDHAVVVAPFGQPSAAVMLPTSILSVGYVSF